MELIVVGLSHKTAPLEVRESVAFGADQVSEALQLARGEKVLQEALILSTCNRTEIYSFSNDAAKAEAYVRSLIYRFKGNDLLGTESYSYTYRDREMARHLFRVAAGLESMMLGEMQILGQVKDAYALASRNGSTGVILNRMLSSAIHVGKRARAETEIGAGAVSIASAAVALTTKIFSDPSGKRVLLVGAGETGRLAAKHFAECRPAGLMIANRTMAKAQALAAELGGEALGLDALAPALARADVVVCATSSPGVMVDQDMVKRVMRERGDRPLVFVDIAVPRDVAPAVSRLDNVFLYSIDALRTIVDQNLARRSREVPKVEAIVEEEIEGFFRWMRSLEVTPTVRLLRERVEGLCEAEIKKHASRLSAPERERVETVTRAVINKLLHQPIARIKSFDTDSEDGLLRLDAVRELFDLGSEGGAGTVSRREDRPRDGQPAAAAEGEGSGGRDRRDSRGRGLDGSPAEETR